MGLHGEIASIDGLLRYVLRRVCIRYGWRLALAGDNTHNQIADWGVRDAYSGFAALACSLFRMAFFLNPNSPTPAETLAPELAERVARVLHGVAGRFCKSLELKGNRLQHMQHRISFCSNAAKTIFTCKTTVSPWLGN